MTHLVRPAGPEDLDAAADVLAAAFDRYSWTRWSIPADDYSHRLKALQRLYLGHALKHGIVLVEARLRAVAAFLPPGAPAPDEPAEREIAALHGSRLAVLGALRLPAPPTEAWTLETVGVDPAHQGAGLGSAVTLAGLETAGEHGAPVALETSDERNVRLYQRLGFETTATTFVQSGPTVYSMLRAAAA
ncbi:GNAT family N-acetyltransferase [Agromyces sp. G08B096]|uniref:GNAT family N-acetyltransferase n=1 Tax=Agromyces sp. G08B096 TaxID=3156399 RepID=A0AAU7W7N3_9MICO